MCCVRFHFAVVFYEICLQLCFAKAFRHSVLQTQEVLNVAKAKQLHIPKEKWVYLHGCADAHDHWFLSDRINFYSSPAMSTVARETFHMADCKISDIVGLGKFNYTTYFANKNFNCNCKTLIITM